ncbi:MAG: DNA-3-methyladenine glycosylase 2 family protein [Patescibacteria group bacterium]|nr:DNA-3-methyladenine glycosylase 2 family protein [Patescibacteria group bacterium]MCL5262082.1 DNA-3-methyladenine glycosylase 2 family protein [Patescibacteria group bacterium]
MRKVLEHFQKYDSKIYPYLKNVPGLERLNRRRPNEYFGRLCRAIIFQQISGKAGDAILKKFLALFPGGRATPKRILSLSDTVLRRAGVSPQKSKYLKSLAEHFASGRMKTKKFESLSDEEIISELVKVKGIGRWTAEMFLMFTLGREDIFSPGDLGLKKGLMKVYGLKEYPSERRTADIIRRWSPYKTYGCLALWHSNDKKD